jgi:hypothetical protein
MCWWMRPRLETLWPFFLAQARILAVSGSLLEERAPVLRVPVVRVVLRPAATKGRNASRSYLALASERSIA